MGIFVSDGSQFVIGRSRERAVELPDDRRQIGLLIAGVELQAGSLQEERDEDGFFFQGETWPLGGSRGRQKTHPSSQVFGDQRHQQAGRGQQ